MNVPDLDSAQAAELGAQMMREPICQRYISRVRASGDNCIYSVDDVLGERLLRCATLLILDHHHPGIVVTNLAGEGHERTLVMLAIAKAALTASPYLWTEEVRAGLRGNKIPRHTISPSLLPEPRIWNTFETGINVEGTFTFGGQQYTEHIVDVTVFTDAGVGLQVLTIGEMTDADGKQRQTVLSSTLRYGAVYPDDFPDESLRNNAEGILTMLAFLNSPYIPKQRQPASRGARRESKRMGRPIDDAAVTFVILRRPQSGQHRTGGDAPSSVDRKHRWIVSGHMRAQWYPSEEAHHLIWIAPHMKGPNGAPLLKRAYKVAR